MTSLPGKTAPRLYQDLLTYDPRHEDRAGRNLLTSSPPHHDPSQPPQPAVPGRNCRHVFMIKHDQSVLPVPGQPPDDKTVYKVASFCQNCLYHVDVMVDFRDHGVRKEPCPTKDTPLHHFIHRPDATLDPGFSGMYDGPRTFRFQCSSFDCPVEVRIRMQPPRLKDEYIHLMTDGIQLRRRLESAKQIDPDRQDHVIARPVDGLDFLSSYLKDSLNPTKGKGRIPLLNRKFLVTFGRNCDDMLRDLGFTSVIEKTGTNEEFCWYLPKPPPSTDALAGNTLRTKIDDAIQELSVYIANRPHSEKQGVRNGVYQPKPSATEICRALGCLDYSKISLTRAQAQNAKGQEEHPYYAGLGALGDFSDTLLVFAYSRQVGTDAANSAYYFECLQDLAIGRKSSMLEEKVQMLASEGQTNRKEIATAYSYFGIDLSHITLLSDDVVIGRFKSRMQDTSPAYEEETRQMLRIIGQARGSSKILQEASSAIETYSQALSWLDLDETHPDEFVVTMFSLKNVDTPGSKEIARKAVEIIAMHRNSSRLNQFLKEGVMDEAEMDIADAYQFLGIMDRSANVDQSVLAIYRDTAISDNKDPVKAKLAFDLISREKGNAVPAVNLPPKHPLDKWPVGCTNTGNTCYLNSVLQFLFTIKPLRDLVMEFANYKQECTPEAIKDKKVGRRHVTLERVKRAQEFMEELKALFALMITAPSSSVTPERKLVILALLNESNYSILNGGTSDDQPMENGAAALGETDGRPVYGPLPNPVANGASQPASGASNDTTMVDVDSQEASNPFADPDSIPTDGDKEDHNWQQEQVDVNPSKQPPAAPSHPPPPVPPRPNANAKTMLQKAEAAAQQQDAAEILNNIFDLIRCAIKPEGSLEDGEQQDQITDLFFSRIKTVQSTNDEHSTTYQLHDNILASPGDYARHIYRALDDEFDRQDVDGSKKMKYEEINRLPPILVINVRRLIFDKEKGAAKRIESHLRMDNVLFFDRYLEKTNSLSSDALLDLREKKWEIDKQRRLLEDRRGLLQRSELGMGLADAVDETADFFDGLEALDSETLIDIDAIPVPAGLAKEVRCKADDVRKESEILDHSIGEVEQTINSYFENLQDHPYRLQAVFIHRGSAAGGHYYIFIHDFKENIWRRYNDETVEEVEDLKEIFEQEEKHPGLSTGMVYVQQESVLDLVEAVNRHPDLPPEGEPSQGDVEMEDVQGSDAEWGELLLNYLSSTDEVKRQVWPLLKDQLKEMEVPPPPSVESLDLNDEVQPKFGLPSGTLTTNPEMSMEVVRARAKQREQAHRLAEDEPVVGLMLDNVVEPREQELVNTINPETMLQKPMSASDQAALARNALAAMESTDSDGRASRMGFR